MNPKRHIPNLITCGNLFCGCLAIVSAFRGDLVWSAYFVGIAAVLDFFDGFVARLLKVYGEMGKQLDSMADMVTFGAVPGVIMYLLIKTAIFNHFSAVSMGNAPETDLLSEYLPYTGFLITIFSGLRLAKFNIDTRQTTSFIGLPTPANAMVICSLPLIMNQFDHDPLTNDGGGVLFITNALNNNFILLILMTVVMSYLLIAEIPLFALKFKNFSWADNKIRYLFVLLALTLLIVFQYIAIPFIIFLYILFSITNNYYTKSKTQEPLS